MSVDEQRDHEAWEALPCAKDPGYIAESANNTFCVAFNAILLVATFILSEFFIPEMLVDSSLLPLHLKSEFELCVGFLGAAGLFTLMRSAGNTQEQLRQKYRKKYNIEG